MLVKNRTAAAFVVALIFGVAGVVVAAGPGTPPNIIPYRGHLDIAGAPFNGTTNITFRLYDDADPAQSTLNWSETIAVTVQGGGFGVLLGQSSSIPNAALNSADLYLGVEVEGTPLVGTQRISPAPIAVRADRAYALDVETDATVGGQVSASSVSATTIFGTTVTGTTVSGDTVSGDSVSGTTVSASSSVSAPTLTAMTSIGAPTGNITTITATNVNSANGNITQFDAQAARASASLVSPYTRTNQMVIRRVDQNVFNNNTPFRNMTFVTRASLGAAQGAVTCAIENEVCLACFGDAAGSSFVNCGATNAGNKNCLCVGPE